MAITRWGSFSELERLEPGQPLPWEPLREFERLQRRMSRLFEQLMPSGNGDVGALAFMPSAEMKETGNTVYLKLEIPGLEAKDLEIEVTEEAVSISGERKSETKTEEKGMLRSEFCYGKFERQIPLPVHVQSDQAQAEYRNGVLTLTLPKVEGEKRSRKSSKLM
jgi:HSP20 family protein